MVVCQVSLNRPPLFSTSKSQVLSWLEICDSVFYSLVEDDDFKDDPNYEVTRSYENGRIQHIKMKKGVSPAELRFLYHRLFLS